MDTLQINEDYLDNVEDSSPFPLGKWNLDQYINRIQISIASESDDMMELEFDLVKVESPIANALRRVLISEVPTMAIEKVYLYQNTSCVQDEVLCHRFGLLPIKSDSSLFQFPQSSNANSSDQNEYIDEEPEADPNRNLIFKLNISCPSSELKSSTNIDQRVKKKAKGRPSNEFDYLEGQFGQPSLLKNENTGNWTMYSSAFHWHPLAGQEERFADDPPRLVNGDIIIAKLRPGQEIEASCHCVKGVARDHAKFSPVATATYRLLPIIKLTRKIHGEQAQRLKSSFSKDVIGIDSSDSAYVKNARIDTSSRNIFQHDDLKDAVQMSKKKDHFIFCVESTGASSSRRLVEEACSTMKAKIDLLRNTLLLVLK